MTPQPSSQAPIDYVRWAREFAHLAITANATAQLMYSLAAAVDDAFGVYVDELDILALEASIVSNEMVTGNPKRHSEADLQDKFATRLGRTTELLLLYEDKLDEVDPRPPSLKLVP